MLASERRWGSLEIIVVAALGVIVVGFAAFLCVAAFNYQPEIAAPPRIAGLESVPAPRFDAPLATATDPQTYAAPKPFALPTPAALAVVAPRAAPAPAPLRNVNAPLPPTRPQEVTVVATSDEPVPLPPRRTELTAPSFTPPVQPGSRPLIPFVPLGKYDQFTAVYDISAHTVYLPGGQRLEAHSGLGEFLDDPRRVNEKDRGPTPPHLYELTLRESLFHGVQALRLNPVGEGEMYGRDGLLTHTYMLGARGDSNGCVSFKDYEQFLAAYQGGQVKRLMVVTALGGGFAGREFASANAH